MDEASFLSWERGDAVRVSAPSETVRSARHFDAVPRTVGVVIVSHNYGEFLGEAIESVQAQTRPVNAIVVVDDASTDETVTIANQYEPSGVQYLRIDAHNVHAARAAGFRATPCEALCFLDADDALDSRYIELGLQEFTEPRVAVVYSDVEYFGVRNGRSRYPGTFATGELHRTNFIHAGSLVRREALVIGAPFDVEIDPTKTLGDWFLWRRVLTGNWTARKQKGTYFYRQHLTSWSRTRQERGGPEHYYHRAGLEYETVTLFVALSGRRGAWERLRSFLERQNWPRHQLRIVFLDTSQDPTFSDTVRQWISISGWPDVRHVLKRVGMPGLADADRRRPEVRKEVVKAMWRIYGGMLEAAATEYLWVLEDDIVPPNDVVRRLLCGFDSRTASVAAPYWSRYQPRFVAWSRTGEHFSRSGDGVEVVGGNGFGCTMLRCSALKDQVFGPFAGADDFDIAFYRRLAMTSWLAKIDWSSVCEHGEPGSCIHKQ